MKRYSLKHVGRTFRTKESLGGYVCTVIDGGTHPGYCTVQIKDWVTEACFSAVKRGIVKYPYFPSHMGVGFLGDISQPNKSKGRAYAVWSLMLSRCYDPNFQIKTPTYKDVEVCAQWHNFSVFSLWFYRYYPRDGLDYELDKDVLCGSDKVYGPDTCLFLPRELNIFMARDIRSNNTSGHRGVTWNKLRSRWIARIYKEEKHCSLGSFKNIDEAAEAYRVAREKRARELQAHYSFDYPKHVLDRLK